MTQAPNECNDTSRHQRNAKVSKEASECCHIEYIPETTASELDKYRDHTPSARQASNVATSREPTWHKPRAFAYDRSRGLQPAKMSTHYGNKMSVNMT